MRRNTGRGCKVRTGVADTRFTTAKASFAPTTGPVTRELMMCATHASPVQKWRAVVSAGTQDA